MTLDEFHRRGPRGFWHGFLRGFGAMYDLGPRPFNPPRYPRNARAMDMARIGRDMWAAMKQVDDEIRTSGGRQR